MVAKIHRDETDTPLVRNKTADYSALDVLHAFVSHQLVGPLIPTASVIDALLKVLAAVFEPIIAWAVRRHIPVEKATPAPRPPPKVTIHGVAFQMDASENAKLGMAILVDLAIADACGLDCHLGAYFQTSDGVPLRDTNDSYRSYDNVVSVGITLTPERIEQHFTSVRLFMPYEELHLVSGTHQLRFYVAVHRWHGTETLATTGFYNWSFTCCSA